MKRKDEKSTFFTLLILQFWFVKKINIEILKKRLLFQVMQILKNIQLMIFWVQYNKKKGGGGKNITILALSKKSKRNQGKKKLIFFYFNVILCCMDSKKWEFIIFILTGVPETQKLCKKKANVLLFWCHIWFSGLKRTEIFFNDLYIISFTIFTLFCILRAQKKKWNFIICVLFQVPHIQKKRRHL